MKMEPNLSLNEKETDAYFNFYRNHKCRWWHFGKRRIMVEFNFESGIGINVIVRCSCGVEKDITDYGCW